MKNVIFALAFMLVGTFAFANNSIEKTVETKIVETVSPNEKEVLEVKIETKIIAKKYLCTRSCFYQGGELLGCTEWECTEIIELDEVIIQA